MKRKAGLVGIVFLSMIFWEVAAQMHEEPWDQKIAALVTAFEKNRYHLTETQKSEILSWGAAGIRAILRFQPDDDQYQNHVLPAFLKPFGKDTLPVLEQALAEKDQTIFERAISNYWPLIKESPLEAKRFFARAMQWKKSEKEKFLCIAAYFIFNRSFFETADRYPQALELLQMVLMDQVEISGDYTHLPWYYWGSLRENSIPPFFDRFLENYFVQQQGPIYKPFWEIVRKICIDFPGLARASEQPQELKEVLQEFDLRDQGKVIGHFAEQLLPWNEARQRGRRLDMQKVFPVDRSAEGKEFLEHFIRRDPGKTWTDAACVLGSLITEKEMTAFAEELHLSGQKEKSDFLKELTETGCNEFGRLRSASLLQCFQPVGEENMAPDGPYDFYEVEKVFRPFLENRITALSIRGAPPRRILTAVAQSGTLMERIYALDILAGLKPEIPHDYFLNWLRRDNDPWIKAVCLSSLQKQNTPVPADMLAGLLGSDNPFLACLAVASVPGRGESRFDPILHELAVSGDRVCQHLVLQKILERSGYDTLQAVVQEIPREKQSLLTRILLLNQSFLHRDVQSLLDQMNFNERPEIMIPAANALYALDRFTAIKAALQMLETSPEILAKRISDKEISQEDVFIYSAWLVELLARSQDPSVLPAVFGLFKKADNYQVENAVESGLQLFTENTLREMNTRYAADDSILPLIERALKKKLEDPVASCKAKILEYQKEEKKETPGSMIAEAFLDADRSIWQWRLKELLEANPADPVGELLAYARGSHEATALNALKLLLDFPEEPRIAALMREKLDAPQLHLRIPSLIWLARRKSPEALQRFLAVSDESLCRPVVEKILSPMPTPEGLEITLQFIARRRYDLWNQLDSILAAYARANPELILSALNTTDPVILAKLVKACGLITGPAYRRKLKRLLAHEDAAVAVTAFFSMRDLLTADDLGTLKNLYQRFKDEVVRGELLETMENLDPGSARLQVKDQEKVLSLYRRMLDCYHAPRALLNLLEKGPGLPLYFKGVVRLAYLDPVLGARLIFRHHAMAGHQLRRMLIKEDEPGDAAEAKPMAMSLKTPSKLDPVKERFSDCIPEKENQYVWQSAVMKLSSGYVHMYISQENGSGDENKDMIHLHFSLDLKQWTDLLSWQEPMRVEGLKLLELADGRLLVFYLRCKDPESLFDPRPFMVLINRDRCIEKQFFPLPEDMTFSTISLIHFQNRYVLAGIPENGCTCNDEKTELQVFTSPDLQHWTLPPQKTNLTGSVCELNLRILGKDPRLFLFGNGMLYGSKDLKTWDQLYSMPEFTIADIQPCPKGYMAVLTSNRLAFWATFLSFSRDLRNWTKPLYTATPHARSGFWDVDHPLLLLQDRALNLDMEIMQRDSDQDGLTDLEEQVLFTDADSPDTDADSQPDSQDKNPLRRPTANPDDRQQIRQLVVQDYMAKAEKFGFGGLLIVVGEGEETQSIEGMPYTVLFFNPADFKAYQEFHAGMGDFYRLYFGKMEIAEDKRSATVLFSYYFHGTAAAGYRITLRKMKGAWQIISFEMLWIS